ncbi:hypothetical protein [Bacillus sp. BP-3]|uniref:hypothetical protein n=1 Tax=Bacillus sp. BP-3 TaxID=3022773 RepID=UPI00232DF989|nr:hypothetical protein [Bacillus sp. BP-3]MDC2865396.1 hypothetical protein [Bacillus sp. BP-3]
MKRDEFTSKNVRNTKEHFNLEECCYLNGWQLSPFYKAVDHDSFSQSKGAKTMNAGIKALLKQTGTPP